MQADSTQPAPAIFFDRDNTLIVNDGYLGDPTGVVLMPGAADAVGRAKQLGFVVVTVSNQSGVARGLFDEAAVQAVDARMDQLLLAAHPQARIDLHVYCPFHPDAVVPAYRKDSPLRKPAPGMLLLAAEKLNLDLARSWVIGDAPRDIAAGVNAGCRTILFRPPHVSESPAANEKAVQPDFTVDSLIDAVTKITRTLT
jgi:D-glycero-D-manno-heptose 1,7-bisphosphate phosphatase